jgi:hypothetical protein
MAANVVESGVVPNSPVSVVAGAELQSVAPPFMVVVFSLVTLAACKLKAPTRKSRLAIGAITVVFI